MNLQQAMEFHFGSWHLTVRGTAEEPAFRASDACSALSLGSVGRALARIPEKYKLTCVEVTSGQARTVCYLTEAGLYCLIFRSDKPEAQKFREFVFEVVLPAWRRGIRPVDSAAAHARMADARLAARPYLSLRGVGGSPCGLSHNAARKCRADGIGFTPRRHGGHEYPIHVLDAVLRQGPDTTALPSPLEMLAPRQLELPMAVDAAAAEVK